MTIKFQKATRKKVKLKVLVMGPSGSGKTIGSLELARGIAGPNGKVAVIDSEKDRSEFYADRYDFDKMSLTDLRCRAYGEAIHAAVEAGYDVIVTDSLSHAWLDLLERKEWYDAANPASNKWTNWSQFTPEWDKLIRYILECPVHIICTARSKQAHEQVEQDGKKKVIKLGLAPQLRENTEYEFAIAFSLNDSHFCEATKDNTFLFGDKMEPINLLDGTVAKKLNKWLETAGDAPKPVAPLAPPSYTPPQTQPTQAPAQPAKKRTTATKNSANGQPTATEQTPLPAAKAPPTLAGMKERLAKAKFKSGEDLGAAIGYIITHLPSVSNYTPDRIDILEAIREAAQVHDLATEDDFWKNWSPDMVDAGKAAAMNWLNQVK